jgi:hypothetical protein
MAPHFWQIDTALCHIDLTLCCIAQDQHKKIDFKKPRFAE